MPARADCLKSLIAAAGQLLLVALELEVQGVLTLDAHALNANVLLSGWFMQSAAPPPSPGSPRGYLSCLHRGYVGRTHLMTKASAA